MEVEEAVEDTDPQQVFAEYGDNGELDLDYGGLLAEVEQEPDTTPVHSAPAAYEDISPPRLVPKATYTSKIASRHLPWSQTKPAAGETAGGSCSFNKYTSLRLLCIVLTCHPSVSIRLRQAIWQCYVSPASISSSVQLRHKVLFCLDDPEHIVVNAGIQPHKSPLQPLWQQVAFEDRCLSSGVSICGQSFRAASTLYKLLPSRRQAETPDTCCSGLWPCWSQDLMVLGHPRPYSSCPPRLSSCLLQCSSCS